MIVSYRSFSYKVGIMNASPPVYIDSGMGYKVIKIPGCDTRDDFSQTLKNKLRMPVMICQLWLASS